MTSFSFNILETDKTFLQVFLSKIYFFCEMAGFARLDFVFSTNQRLRNWDLTFKNPNKKLRKITKSLKSALRQGSNSNRFHFSSCFSYVFKKLFELEIKRINWFERSNEFFETYYTLINLKEFKLRLKNYLLKIFFSYINFRVYFLV